MKKIIASIVSLVMLLTVNNVNAQNELVSVINFDSKGLIQSPVDIRKIVNMELQKINKYKVLDEYDLTHKLIKEEIDLSNCYGKDCASEVGEKLGVQKVITGSLLRYDEKITYNIRIINVTSSITENSIVFEFANQQTHIDKMTEIMLKKLFDLPVEEQKINELAYLENPIISNTNKLKASGPRIGIAYITEGTTSNYLEIKGKYPVMTQFGYQAEAQYMSTGNFQALFEFVGLVSGMDQGMFNPTLSFLNGFRNTKSGLEFALGPVFGLDNYVEFGHDANGNAVITKDYIDGISFSFAYAVGKTFKSGNLNIPINIYVSPNKTKGWFLGASMGFNLAKYSK